MNQYILKGIVHPERALIQINTPIKLGKVTSITYNKDLDIELNININQITIWIKTLDDWDIYDLRNIGRALTYMVCSIVTFIYGNYYEIEITQILCKEKEIDYVFSIDTPCISERSSVKDFKIKFPEILNLITKEYGIYFQRCFKDLNSALKDTEDTAFYCYRAIESLKQYCKAKYNIAESEERRQWAKVSEICGYEENYIADIKEKAATLRHAGYSIDTGNDRANFLLKTWNVIESFIKNII